MFLVTRPLRAVLVSPKPITRFINCSIPMASASNWSRNPAPTKNRGYKGRRPQTPVKRPSTADVLVVDLEATCWRGPPPPGERNEIIEIGWAVLNVPTKNITRSGTILVKPEHSTVSEFCTEFTTLTQADVDGGVSLADAFQELREMEAKNMSWASYGQYDLNMLNSQANLFNLDYPMGDTHTNVKSLFLEKFPSYNSSRNMRDVYNHVMGEDITGTHHRGGDDAYNIARLLGALLSS